ncbi:enoyl-CoA hydratase/isomerase family protein [SAR202 cluster bacterium AD-804-J14_MRT_500m]|nr:enoyl-CoA hydratase/isomerase family protein [SAR202 cluster bacterium AD-804-J14_MRT_500m]
MSIDISAARHSRVIAAVVSWRCALPKQPVLTTQQGSIRIVRLDSPDNRNLITPEISRGIKSACAEANEDPSVLVLIITGSIEVFSSGRDRYTHECASDPTFDFDNWLIDHRVADAVSSVKATTIAAIEGEAIDHGLELAIACDIRVASDNSQLGANDLTSGILPWDGCTQRLPRLVGVPKALELLLTGKSLTGREAADIGLVNHVVSSHGTLTAALEMARTIIQSGPLALRYIKEAIYKSTDLPLDQGLALEADLSFILQSTNDRQEGIQSFHEKRRPKFTGR